MKSKKRNHIPPAIAGDNYKVVSQDGFLALLFFVSALLGIYSGVLYRDILIHAKYVFTVSAFGGIVAALVLLFWLKGSYSMFQLFLFSSVIGGCLASFCVFFINSFDTNNKIAIEDFQILKTRIGSNRSGSCGAPYAIIDFEGVEKELRFGCDYKNSINTYSAVRLAYADGLLGFKIIKSKTLIK